MSGQNLDPMKSFRIVYFCGELVGVGVLFHRFAERESVDGDFCWYLCVQGNIYIYMQNLGSR